MRRRCGRAPRCLRWAPGHGCPWDEWNLRIRGQVPKRGGNPPEGPRRAPEGPRRDALGRKPQGLFEHQSIRFLIAFRHVPAAWGGHLAVLQWARG